MKQPVLLLVVLSSVMVHGTVAWAGQRDAGSQAPPSGKSSAVAETKTYIQPALFGITRLAGVPNHRVWPPISGSALGASIAFGSFLWGAVALEGEFAMRGTVATPQRFSYNWLVDYTGEVRDRSFGALVRWRPRGVRHVELMGGYGLVVTTVTERDRVRTNFQGPFAGTERQGTSKDTSYEPMVNGGVATPIRVGRKMAIVPTFAVRWVAWPVDGEERYSGVGRFVYQFGVGARFGL
jgi:hypothetical protein